jgi:hypothetical protein
VNDNQPLTGLTTSSSPTSHTDTPPATVKPLFLCQDVCPSDLPPSTILPRDECCRGFPGDALCILCNAGPLSLSATSHWMVHQSGHEILFLLMLPRDECCWGLPGDAHSILCNAGPLSLSAYSQSPNTQTTDTTLPSSTQLQPLPHATNRPISPSVPRPKSLQASSALRYATNESHSITQKTTSCRASVSADLPPPMTLLRDECCRGLPGDAHSLPCNAGPLSLSATSQVLRYYSLCRCLETSAAGASQGMLTVSSAMQAPCLSRHILRVTILRPLILLCPARLTYSLSHLLSTDQFLRQSHSQHPCKPLSHYAMLPTKVTVFSRRQRCAELVIQLIYHR